MLIYMDLPHAGGVREPGPGEDKQDIINEAGKQEIALTLTNKLESLAKDDSSDMKALFVRYSNLCNIISHLDTIIPSLPGNKNMHIHCM